MAKNLSERRLIENEVFFRQANETAQRELDKLKETAKAEGCDFLPESDNMPLHFYCECSDENCRERIVLTLSSYKKIHRNRRQFIIKSLHEVPAVETIVHEQSDYAVARKRITPPETVAKLQPTDIQNV